MKKFKITPYLYIIISFLAVILVGTSLLMLPISTVDREGLNFVNSLFMAVSATCVTGLSVVSNVGLQMSIFGKVILAILMEIGGLSFLTIASFIFVILGRKIGIGSRYLMKEALNLNSAKGVVRLIKKIILISFTIQSIGIIINFFILNKYYDSFLETLGISIFHTISSFNNAGFDIFGYESSMINFSNDILLNLSTMTLIVLGGLGFIVILDLFTKKKYNKGLSFHTKIVLTMTLSLIVFGTLLIKFALRDEITWLEALFSSVTARTAGFATIDMSSLKGTAAYPLMIFLMFVGASPSSTGGGIKTTTLFTLLVTMFYMAQGKRPKAFKRNISEESILKAMSLTIIALCYICIMIFVISYIEINMGMDEVVFEIFSAFGTVGLSMGITTQLSTASRILLSLTMFIGRIGPLTFVSLWNKKWMNNTSDEIKYIEERIIVG